MGASHLVILGLIFKKHTSICLPAPFLLCSWPRGNRCRPRDARPRVSVNFRKFLHAWRPRWARARVAVTYLRLGRWNPQISMNTAVLILLLSFSAQESKASLDLCAKRKQTYQNGSIHRKLKVPMSVISPRPRTQCCVHPHLGRVAR
jgi:hypothetical protein